MDPTNRIDPTFKSPSKARLLLLKFRKWRERISEALSWLDLLKQVIELFA